MTKAAVPPPGTGVLAGDCLELLARVPEGSVQLVYADPPFFSGRRRHALRSGRPATEGAFEDRWSEGIEGYLDWLRPRLHGMRRVLARDGSLFLHLDWHAAHHVRVELDRLFGASAFRNEIVWHYPGWARDLPGHFSRKHDTLLFYARGPRSKFRPVAVPWTREDYLARRKQRVHVEEGTGREFIYDGRGARGARRYLDEALAEGRFLDDVWEVGALTSSARERVGYATQKPEALLEIVVRAASDPGDLVLDPFCGSGTTLAAALRLGRRALGFDVSPEAVRIARRRIAAARTPSLAARRAGR